MKFILTIDTEADNQWNDKSSLAVNNLDYIKPVYLCTTEILESEKFDKNIASYCRENKAETGAHLHPWSSPPFEKSADSTRTYPSELPIELFEKKMSELTELIKVKTGKPPLSYRAGRWGFDYKHVPILEKLGYKVESSLTPFVSWHQYIGDKSGGPRVSIWSPKPFLFENSSLLEVPPTIMISSCILNSFTCLKEAFVLNRQNFITKVFAKIFNLGPHWLRPYPTTSLDKLINLQQKSEVQTEVQNLPVTVMMFHSSELMPGGSPYNQDKDSIEKLYAKLDSFFAYLNREKIESITLSESYNMFNKSGAEQ
jgi:hypothetical protein